MSHNVTFNRHDLLFLTGIDLADKPDGAIITEWIKSGFPAIVCRPGLAFGGEGVHCGIALPPGQGGKRIGFIAPLSSIKRRAELPGLEQCLEHLPHAWQAQLAEFHAACRNSHFRPEVFGSLAWQHWTGRTYLHKDSDVDLRFRLKNSMELGRMTAMLRQFPQLGKKQCDIELELWNGQAFSWREFEQPAPQIMIKTVNSVFLLKKSRLHFGKPDDPAHWPEAIAFEAESALREELESYPKPGLVSYVDNGSHPDMTARHFSASIAALRDYFKKIAAAGVRGAEMTELRQIGIEAEKRMLTATGGVNTHRGAIFTLGLLAAAAGYKIASGAPDNLGAIVGKLWGHAIMGAELQTKSHGDQVSRRYGCTGAKAEAAGGFPSVYKFGLPAFKSVLEAHGRNAARTHAFFAMLEMVSDTTLLHRGGLGGLELARNAAGEFNRRGGVNSPGWGNRAVTVHREFVARNLSCGGVADLLAATIFIQRMEELCPV